MQAGIIGHKKDGAAATLREMRDSLSHMTHDLGQKRELASHVDGSEVLRGEDVKSLLIFFFF